MPTRLVKLTNAAKKYLFLWNTSIWRKWGRLESYKDGYSYFSTNCPALAAVSHLPLTGLKLTDVFSVERHHLHTTSDNSSDWAVIFSCCYDTDAQGSFRASTHPFFASPGSWLMFYRGEFWWRSYFPPFCLKFIYAVERSINLFFASVWGIQNVIGFLQVVVSDICIKLNLPHLPHISLLSDFWLLNHSEWHQDRTQYHRQTKISYT